VDLLVDPGAARLDAVAFADIHLDAGGIPPFVGIGREARRAVHRQLAEGQGFPLRLQCLVRARRLVQVEVGADRNVFERLRPIVGALAQALHYAGMEFGSVGDLACFARARPPDWPSGFVVSVLQAVGRQRLAELVGRELQAGIQVVDFLHHPFEGDVRETVVFVAAPDIGMRTGEPHLLDPFALGPRRRREVGAVLVDGQRLAAVFDARTEFAVGKSQEAEFVPVGQT